MTRPRASDGLRAFRPGSVVRPDGRAPRCKRRSDERDRVTPQRGRPHLTLQHLIPTQSSLSDHHLVPKSRGGKITKTLCRDCHKAIHAVFTNAELETAYDTVDALMSHAELAKMIRFIAKQHGRVRVRSTNRRGKASS